METTIEQMLDRIEQEHQGMVALTTNVDGGGKTFWQVFQVRMLEDHSYDDTVLGSGWTIHEAVYNAWTAIDDYDL